MEENRKRNIEDLKAVFEETIGGKIQTPKHFDQLRQLVFTRTGEYLSSTTLKRIWGYVNEPTLTRVSTLSILSKALGYRDWDDFVQRKPTENGTPSSIKFGKNINVNTDLTEGQLVTLFWFPNRVCTIRYLGGISFEVVEAKFTQLLPGDRFDCHLFLAGYPLYLSNLVRGNSKPAAYICGKLHGGIQFKVHSSKNPEDSAAPSHL